MGQDFRSIISVLTSRSLSVTEVWDPSSRFAVCCSLQGALQGTGTMAKLFPSGVPESSAR